MATSNDRIVWIDCEMTGLSPEKHSLLEVAALVTDGQLNFLDEGIEVVIFASDEALAQMEEVVRKMLTESKLLPLVPQGLSMEEAQELVLAYIKKWVPEPGQAPLGGNSVGGDRSFLVRNMPAIVEHLDYRVIDVSSIKELSKRWYPILHRPKKGRGHRALVDVKASIAELRYYRRTIFVPDQGPDSDTSREIWRELLQEVTPPPTES